MISNGKSSLKNKNIFGWLGRWFHVCLMYRIRYFVRMIAFFCPVWENIWKHLFHSRMVNQDSAFWNKELSGQKSFYFGGVTYIEARKAMIPVLIRYTVPHVKRVLDVGCVGSSLAKDLFRYNIEQYTGIDISDYAIRKAERDMLKYKQDLDVRFHACDLREFKAEDGERYDIIIFSEVLYYLSVQEAKKQVERFSAWLRPNGGLCISMKDDPKSHAIYRGISKKFQHAGSILYQYNRSDLGLRHRIVINQEFPRFVIACFTPSK